MTGLFGTDGIRGVANIEPITAETALAIGRATAHVCKKHSGRLRVVIGKDTRISGYMLENALTAGICSMGVDVLLVGPMPTPGIAFITRNMRADAGIVISASHNQYQDNGIKIFSHDGYKIADDVEKEIEELVLTERIKNIRPTAAEIGKAFRIDDAIGRYIVFCKNTFPETLSLSGLRVAIDCANGATYRVAPIIFSELGAEVVTINNHPNGMNINKNSGALFTDGLAEKVLNTGSDIGLAFDGDGDRIQAIDEKGNKLTGDHLLVIMAKSLKQDNLLRNNTIVSTPMSNLGFHLAMSRMDIKVEIAAVGDRYVLQKMRQINASFGGEDSGHIIFHDHHTTGDGIISALQLLAVMQKTNLPLSVLANDLKLAPQRLVNIDVHSKPDLDTIPQIRDAITAAEEELGNEGRVFVRYSGTEPICRVMVESNSKELTDRLAYSIAEVVESVINR
ncbi:MAG: phosphoglucosamine mutase [Lentisphaerae bacterium]|nr:phosphoglucosamine mutase [Lentisphaerota bacterium]